MTAGLAAILGLATAGCSLEDRAFPGAEAAGGSGGSGPDGGATGGCNGGLCGGPRSCMFGCGLYLCGGKECKDECTPATEEQDCAPNAYCDDTVCAEKKAKGDACHAQSECAGGLSCSTGVCCDQACEGPCNACQGWGPAGTCVQVPLGVQLDGCDGATACGITGTCEPLGNKAPVGAKCGSKASGTECINAWCVQGMCQLPAGAACQPGDDWQCTTHLCKDFTCTACTADTECAPGICKSPGAGGYCTLANGQPCADEDDCTSDACQDDVCCDLSCTQNCVACTAAKKGSGVDGVCGPMAEGTQDEMECLNVAGCDGMGACK